MERTGIILLLEDFLVHRDQQFHGMVPIGSLLERTVALQEVYSIVMMVKTG